MGRWWRDPHVWSRRSQSCANQLDALISTEAASCSEICTSPSPSFWGELHSCSHRQEQTSPGGLITCVSAPNHPAKCLANTGHVVSPMALEVALQGQSCSGKMVSRGTNKVKPGEMLAKIRSVTCWCHAELHFPPQEGEQWHWGLSLALDGVLQAGLVEPHVHKQYPGNPNRGCSYLVLA